MSLEKDLEKLATAAIENFNGKTGTRFTLVEMDYRLRRPASDTAMGSLLLTTKLGGDNTRFQLDLNGTATYSSMATYNLKIRQNTCAGDLSNEVFVADAVLGTSEYKYLIQHLLSKEFKDYLASVPAVVSKSGAQILTKSGIALFSKN